MNEIVGRQQLDDTPDALRTPLLMDSRSVQLYVR